MAGGKGSRIQELFPDIPKPLIPICDKPILEWEIENLASQGFRDIILTVSHMADKIQNYFKDGKQIGVNIKYFVEKEPLGNAGALFKLLEMGELNGDFLLLNADSMFDIDFQRFIAFHQEKKASVTLFTHPNSHPYDSSIIIADEDNRVKNWLNKEDKRPEFYKNRVNAGLHVINSKALTALDIKSESVDLDRQVLKPLCALGAEVFCYDSPEYVKDMGTPERYCSVLHDFKTGLIKRKNLKQLQKAIFLDRDGTINKYVGFLKRAEQFELLPRVSEAVKLINDSGYLAIVVTNQPVIARGEVTIEELRAIHNKMETLLGEQGAYIDALYYCPHHPDKGFEGEIPELKIDCVCRKPKPGMLLKAAKDYHIDLKNSWIVGDGENDVKAGKAAGCRTALITADNANYGQEMTVTSLLDFVKTNKHIELLFERYPILEQNRDDILQGYIALKETYKHGNKLLIAGNGGSASDSEHIVAELMKSFKLRRAVGKDFTEKLIEIDSKMGTELVDKLEYGLPAISLTSHEALFTAYINDVDASCVFAQQVLNFGKAGDVLLAISTSGNSQNILMATVVAKALDMTVIGLTGKTGGKLAKMVDVLVNVPEIESYKVQELHLPIYHCWCLMLEEEFFSC